MTDKQEVALRVERERKHTRKRMGTHKFKSVCVPLFFEGYKLYMTLKLTTNPNTGSVILCHAIDIPFIATIYASKQKRLNHKCSVCGHIDIF